MIKSGGLLPKIDALPGSLQREWKRCGKLACRCARGELHGPYWYRRWWESGRQHKQYVQPADMDNVLTALADWRRLHPSIWPVRKLLAEISRAMEA